MDTRALEASRIRLVELRREEREQLAVSVVALATSVVLALVYPPLALPLFAGGYGLGALALRTVWRRWELVDRLANDRDARVIPEVGAYANRHGRSTDDPHDDGERRAG